MGKSRLIYECVHSHHTQGWRVLESASVSYGKATPYFPVLDLLKHYCHIDDGDEARTIRARVTGQVLTLDETLQDTLPALLALLDVLPDDNPLRHLDPSQRRHRTLEALRRVLLRESQVQPLLLVCEDLHWIDSETQALLDRLIESLPTARLVLLVNYRPEYQHGWGSKTSHTQLRLDPLPPASAEAFLAALLGDDPSLAPLTSLLSARTAGNPFFLEESVRTLVETGVLVGASGAYRLLQPLQGLPLPATVQAVLAARIDRLAPEDKRLLQTAAVIGTEVPFTLLRAIADVPEAALHRGLAHLQAAEFLYETRLFPEQEYSFKHALTHEVAYGSLLLERRRGLHARLVEAFEVLAPERVDEQVERLAHHALRGEVWGKAVLYCRQAGTRAYDCAAFHEAIASYDQALQALEHLPEHGDTRVLAIELRLALGGPLTSLGKQGRRLALLGEAEALARALDDRARLGHVLAEMGQARRIAGDPDGAMAAGQQAVNLAVELGNSALQVRASYFLGQVYSAMGDFSQAAEFMRRTMEAMDREAGTSSLVLRLQSRAWLARILGHLGAFAEGRRSGEKALRLLMLEGRGQIPILVHGSLGILYLAQGDLEPAIRVLEQGLALCRASGERNWLQNIVGSLGAAYALQGRLAEGRALLEEGINESIRTGELRGNAARLGSSARSVVWRAAARRPGTTHARRSTWPGSTESVPTRRSRYTSLASSRPTPPPRCRAGSILLPASPGSGRRVGHAPAPGALPPGPRHAICEDGPGGAGTHRAVDRHHDVPVDGHDVLAAPDRGSAGADDRTMSCGRASRPHRETLRPNLAHISVVALAIASQEQAERFPGNVVARGWWREGSARVYEGDRGKDRGRP